MSPQRNASDDFEKPGQPYSSPADVANPPLESASPPDSISRWLAVFGPGAIVASLTIGSGELIFSSRGGALFGYRLIGLFLVICLFKWCLVILTARQIVLTGAHPFERWCDLRGPRGWLPIVFLLFALLAFPVWIGFHAGTVGTLLAAITQTDQAFSGGSHFVWGMVALAFVMMLSLTGGYQRLERIQMVLVAVMLATVAMALVLLKPDWSEMVRGLIGFREIAYPAWVDSSIRERPLWVELATYVGVIGGSGYDYLAYVSFMRDKHWGQAGQVMLSRKQLDAIADNREHPNRTWLTAPLVDATLSFLIVFAFSVIFLSLGTIVLQPLQHVPDGTNLLTMQAEFVAHGPPWMRPVYFLGALLAMLGTLYGTIEVAPTIVRELVRSLWPPRVNGSPAAKGTMRWHQPKALHRWVTTWVTAGGFFVLLGSLVYFRASGEARPPALITILTPANLFTGVLACGVISVLAVDADRRHLPLGLRANGMLIAMNLLGAVLFVTLGLKAYWDHSGPLSILILGGTIGVGLFLASVTGRR